MTRPPRRSGDVVTASLAAAIAHGLRMVANLVVVKMIALYVGPGGFGLLGNFMSLITMTTVFAGGGIATGITKYVAEFSHRPRRLLRFLGATVVYGGVFSLLVAAATLLFAAAISTALFSTAEYAWLIRWLGPAHLLAFIGSAVIAAGNGLRQPKEYARITILGHLIALPVAWLLIRTLGIAGSGLALLFVMSCTGVPAIWVALRSPLTRRIVPGIDRTDFLGLLRFSTMAVTSAVAFPTAEIAIRKLLTAQLGNEATGLWQATSRLSGAYLGFFTVFLATYYMPRLASLASGRDQVRVVWRYVAVIAPSFALFAVGIHLARHLVIRLLFSEAFAGMAPLMGWQLLGDTLRVSAYTIGFLGIARGSVWLYVGAEVLQAGMLTLFVTRAVHAAPSLLSVQHAYVLSYGLYLAVAVAALVWFHQRQPVTETSRTLTG
ncbi:MAG: O-antigen translocase [Gemmatimonadaceae bacterium]|nr:O-antigen translocase [Gemmatimonadaceae bacterium]